MPKKVCAFAAGEFLDEALCENDVPRDGWEVYNPQNKQHPFEWWILM